MGKLGDILNGRGGNFNDLWMATKPAADSGPVPPGVYICRLTKITLKTVGPKQTPKVSLEFTIIEGKFKGRKLWRDCWLTSEGLPHTKRDLAKLRITTPEQLEQPIPKWIRCKVQVVVHCDDDGIKRNRVKSFEAIGVDPPEPNPFAPSEKKPSPKPKSGQASARRSLKKPN